MPNPFERFKQRNQKRMDAQGLANTRFIFNGYPSIKIECNTGSSSDSSDTIYLQAAVVNQQEKDKAYIYTQ